MSAPCANQSTLFDSTDLLTHVEARRICERCPIRAECAERAATLPFKEGTWAGVLWRNGRRLTEATICAECGNYFIPKKTGKYRYCSELCRERARPPRVRKKPEGKPKRFTKAANLPACPTCGVEAGKGCRSASGGYIGGPHAARVSNTCRNCSEPAQTGKKYCEPCRVEKARAAKRRHAEKRKQARNAA